MKKIRGLVNVENPKNKGGSEKTYWHRKKAKLKGKDTKATHTYTHTHTQIPDFIYTFFLLIRLGKSKFAEQERNIQFNRRKSKIFLPYHFKFSSDKKNKDT